MDKRGQKNQGMIGFFMFFQGLDEKMRPWLGGAFIWEGNKEMKYGG